MAQKDIIKVSKKIGKLKGEGSVTLELRFTLHTDNDHKMTVDHESLEGKSYLSMGISGEIRTMNERGWHSGGQCQDTIREERLRTHDILPSKVREILDIWDEWHLNDLKAGCCHMEKPQEGMGWDKEEWNRLSAMCPNGYKYGTKWLIKPLPVEVIKRILELFDASEEFSTINDLFYKGLLVNE